MTGLAAALSELRQVRDWLQRPNADTLAACTPALERATAEMSALLKNPPDPGLLPAALQLASELHQAQALLAAAATLYFGRLRRLSESAAG